MNSESLDVASYLGALLGTDVAVEATGGSCTALVVELEAGALLVATGAWQVPHWDGVGTFLGVYRSRDAWEDASDPVTCARSDTPLTPLQLRDLVDAALGLEPSERTSSDS